MLILNWIEIKRCIIQRLNSLSSAVVDPEVDLK